MQSNFQSLESFVTEINRREQSKQDYLTMTPRLEPYETEDSFNIKSEVFNNSVSPYAQHQIASLYNIPTKYWDQMQTVPNLRAVNAKMWFDHAPKPRMVRILDQNIRAMVSDKFKPFDNFMVLNAVLPTLAEHRNDLIIQAKVLTERRMYIQVRFPSVEAEIKDGDNVQAGFIITNSEIGAGSLDIRQSIWRLVCSNGLIRESIFKKYHVGRSIGNNDEDYDIYKEDTIIHEMNAVKGKIRDIVRYSLENDNFEHSVNDLRLAANRPIDNVIESTKNITKRFNIPEKYTDAINDQIYKNGNKNQWGMANAITALAHLVDNPDAAYDFELTGNEVVKLNDHQWSKAIGKN